jgi:hypothetical protein
VRGREKNASEVDAGRFEKPAPDARAAPPEAHESLISRKTGAEVPLTGLSFGLEIPAIDSDCPFSATVRQNTAGIGNRE